MNINQYLERINFNDQISIDLTTLRKLQKQHLLSVPFENLDIHYGRKIILDIDNIYKKVVGENRGGFCYELNGLFYELLQRLGFQVKRLSANVYDEKKGYGPDYDHLCLLVEINQKSYLVDVGFGEFAFYPLEFEIGRVQDDPRGKFVFDQMEENWYHIFQIKEGKRIPQYKFKNINRGFLEYKAMCHYHQTSSISNFTKKRMITIPTENGRMTISGNTFKIKNGEQTEEIQINNEQHFKEILKTHFRIHQWIL